MEENSSVLCTSATIASTCTRFLGRDVSDAAALSFSVRGLLGALVFDADAFFDGLRAGNPLSTRFLNGGVAAIEALVAVGATSADAVGAAAASTAASTDGAHTVPLRVAVSCWSGAIHRDALLCLAIQCRVSPGFGRSLLCCAPVAFAEPSSASSSSSTSSLSKLALLSPESALADGWPSSMLLAAAGPIGLDKLRDSISSCTSTCC